MTFRPLHGRALALAFAALLTATLLAAAELVLTAGGWRERTADFTLRGNDPGGFDRSGRHRRHPRRYYSIAPGYRAGPAHAGRFATGEWPFRGRVPEPAPEGILRVGVLGDSCVYGEGVDVSATLPQQIQVELEAFGYGPCEVQVLNFGVIGYSTLQMHLCLDEVLERWRPRALVLYPAAWNDQAPHLGADDLEILGQRPQPLARVLPATFHALQSVLGREPEPLSPEFRREFFAAWENGTWPYGRRVAAERVGPEVTAMLALGEAAGAPAVVVLPPHPASTVERFPDAVADRERVRSAAVGRGAPLVDGPALFAASGASDERLFVDHVHPSAQGHALLARATAKALAALLPPPAAQPEEPRGALRIRAVEPDAVSCLGDQRVRIELDGWDGRELPAVSLGGAPLLDLERDGAGAVAGVTLQNGPGARELVVQTSAGCAVRELRLEPPSIELVRDGDALVLRARSRPGDLVRVLASEVLRAEPVREEGGLRWLDEPRTLGRIPCGPDGSGAVRVAPSRLPEKGYLQGFVWVPSGRSGAKSDAGQGGDGRFVPAFLTDVVLWGAGD